MPLKESPPDSAVRAHAEILADPDTVRRSLTSGDALKAWWSAWAGCAISNVEIEPRQGGSFLIESRTRRGETHYIKGHFLHWADDLIAFTWATDESSQLASTVLLELEPGGRRGTTRITVTHRDFSLDAERERAPRLWQQILAVMARGIPRLIPGSVAPEVSALLGERTAARKGRTRR